MFLSFFVSLFVCIRIASNINRYSREIGNDSLNNLTIGHLLTNNSSSSSDRDIINSVNNSNNLSSDSYINNDGEHDGKTDINSEYQSLAVIASAEPKHKRKYHLKSIFHH